MPECVKAIKAYLAYSGENTQYHSKAKVAIGHIGTFGRVRSSETNRMQIELLSERAANGQQKVLTSGSGK